MILIVGHEASLTGAPKFILNIGKWLKEEKNEQVIFILREGGALVPEYAKVAPTYVCYLEPNNRNLIETFYNRIHNFLKRRIVFFWLKRKKIDLIFSNTVLNGDILEDLKSIKAPIVSRIPELEYVIQVFAKYKLPQRVFQHSDRFIAVSQAVKMNLIYHHQIPPEKIDVCHGFVSNSYERVNSELNIRNKHGISDDAFLVGGCGSLEWRKGSDLFIQVADQINKEKGCSTIHFIWIGGGVNTNPYLEFCQEIRLMGLDNLITITGTVTNVNDYFHQLDVFLMTSREDPFPLVNLEVGLAGVPIICFDKSGGSPEFVTEEVGYVVDYADTDRMAEKIVELYNNRPLLNRMSQHIMAKAKQYTVDAMAPKLYEILKSFTQKAT